MKVRPSNGDAQALADAQHQDGEIALLRKRLMYLETQVREQAARLVALRPINGENGPMPMDSARLDSLERRLDVLVEETKRLHDVVEAWGLLRR